MIKLIFYFVSILVVVLILLTSPSKNSSTSFVSDSKILNSGYNQRAIQGVIAISITMFFILVIILLFQVS